MTTDTLRDKIRRLVRDELPATKAADEHAGDVADAIIAALPSILPDMVWVEHCPETGGSYAQTNYGEYILETDEPGGEFGMWTPGQGEGADTRKYYPNLEDAKAAANTHHRAAWIAALIGGE